MSNKQAPRPVMSYQQVPEMAVSLDAGLENPVSIVDPAGVPLQAEKHLSCCSRAVDATSLSEWAARREASRSGLYNGDRRLSKPARWSLWMWLKKHARGGRRSGCERKKSTADS